LPTFTLRGGRVRDARQVSDSTRPPGWRHRREVRLLLRVVSVVVALGLVVVAQGQVGQGHVVRASLAIGGMLVVLGWVTDPIVRGVTRIVRGRCGTSS